MITLFLLSPILILFVVLAIVRRVLFSPFRMARRYRRGGFGGFSGGYGMGNGYGYGRQRSGFGGGGLLSILALIAIDRLFTGRRF